MGRPRTFLNWIFSKNKRPYYLDENGHVLEGDVNTHLKPNGQPAHLDAAPTGWKGTTVHYGRNTTYWGVFRDFTATAIFALDGNKILRTLLFAIGFEAQAFFALHKRNAYVWPLKYEPWYIGELDMSKAKLKGKDTTEVAVLDGGIAKYLKAFENTVYEFPLSTDPEAKRMYLDGFPFVDTIEYLIYDGQQFDGSNEAQIGMGVIKQEGSTTGVIYQDEAFGGPIVIPGNENYFFAAADKSLDISLRITGTVGVQMGGSRTFPLFIRKLRVIDDLSVQSTYYALDNTGIHSGFTTVNVDITIPVVANERLYLVAQGIVSSPGIDFTVKQSSLFMAYAVTFKPTFCLGITPKRLADLLMNKMTGGLYQCTSTLLDSIDDILYTSGTAIRNIDDNAQSIKISFADFYKSLKSFDRVNKQGVGVGIEGDKLVIETLSHFFQKAVIMDLGEVSNMGIDVADDLCFNTIKVGYQNQTYDNNNGLDEVNQQQNYTTDVLKVVKELDLIDPVRTDATGIELTRITLFQQDTTDSSSDNDTFKIQVVKGGILQYYTGSFDVVGGKIIITPKNYDRFSPGQKFTISGTGTIDGEYTVVIDPTPTVNTEIQIVETIADGSYSGTLSYTDNTVYVAKRFTYSSISGILQPDKKYNVELSPKNNLYNQGGFIHCFLEDEAGKIHYQTSDKNSALVRTLNGVTVAENADIVVADLADKIFLPYYATFDVDVPLTYKELMDANPYGQITWTYLGDRYYGYAFDGEIKPATNEHINFKMLMAPNNDLKKFI